MLKNFDLFIISYGQVGVSPHFKKSLHIKRRNSYKFNLLRGCLSYKAIFICPKGDLLIQVWWYDNYIREWPFNLKGEGGYVFLFFLNILIHNVDEKNFWIWWMNKKKTIAPPPCKLNGRSLMLWKKVSTVKVRNSININQEQPTSHFQSWKIKK